MYGIEVNENHTLKNVVLTDDVSEQIKIGKSLFEFFQDKYSNNTAKLIRDFIEKKDNSSSQEKDNRFYLSVYDYWTFGSIIDEEYRFGFFGKTCAEKATYITRRWHPIFIRHINSGDNSVVDDKYQLYQLLKEYFKRSIILLTDESSDYPKFCDFVKRGASYVVKPQNGRQTVGVYKITIDAETDLRQLYNSIFFENSSVDSKFDGKMGSSIVIEEWLEQDERMATLHPSSVNGVRIATFRSGNDVRVFYPWLKIGVGNADVTGSEYFGSLDALIDVDTGIVCTEGCTKGGDRFLIHPTTGVMIKGFQVPRWDECVALAKELMRKIDGMNYVGWDLALTPDGWVVIEGNSNGNFNAQWMLGKGLKYELEEILNWKPEKRFWWEK